jgi:hypothetical protein
MHQRFWITEIGRRAFEDATNPLRDELRSDLSSAR